MPQYLIDILAVAMAVIDGPDELGDEALRREKRATEAWDKHEIKRKSNQKFVITYGVDNEIGRRIALEFSYQEEADSWSLQYAFAEEREYEVCGNHLYRVINGQLFGDPVGSEEDLKNIAEKHYLPSRLDLDVLLQPN